MLSITSSSRFFILLLATVLAPKQFNALRMINLDAPETALQGDTIQLSCFFSLQQNSTTNQLEQQHEQISQKSKFSAYREKTGPKRAEVNKHQEAFGEQLYAIKWYKDESEFFRFLAQDWPRKQSFPMDGIIVDVNRSDNHTVVIKGVTLKTSGTFRCEVSTDAPSFVTKSLKRKMTIYSLPNQGPTIEPLKPATVTRGSKVAKVNLDETLEFVCTAQDSKPAAAINWIINDALNLSETIPIRDGSPLFQIKEQRFVRLPLFSSNSSSSNNRPILSHISFNQGTRHNLSTVYELHNESVAVPFGENSAVPTINLAGSLNQLVEVSSSKLKFTVDSDLLQTISSNKLNFSTSLNNELEFARVPQSQGNFTFNGQFVTVRSDPIQVQLSQNSRLMGSPFIKAKTKNLSTSNVGKHPSLNSASIASSINGKRRVSLSNSRVSNAKNKYKFMIQLRCVSRVLHLSMSDEFRIGLTDNLKTRDDDDLASIDPQRRQTNAIGNSGESKYSITENRNYMMFFINSILIIIIRGSI